MTREQIIHRRERARPIVLRTWRKHNPGVRIVPMVGLNPNYYITDDGRVYCFRTKERYNNASRYALILIKQVKPHRAGSFNGGSHNYYEVPINATERTHRFYHKGGRHFSVHRLVAHYFCSRQFFDCTQVDHIDGNPVNNRADNLEWVTPEENTRRAKEMRRLRKKHKDLFN